VFTDCYIVNCVIIGVNWITFAKGGGEKRQRSITKKMTTPVNIYNIQANQDCA
jgi:hypothetical protein